MNKAVFFDRDGVVNKERGNYTFTVEDFEINRGIPEAMKMIKDEGFLIIIITNQGGISKNLYTKEDVERLHRWLLDQLNHNDTLIDEIYYCPHHHDVENCICRKPDSLLLEKAAARFSVSREESYFIGDSERDRQAAEKTGIQPIKINANDDVRNYLHHIIR